MDQSDHEDWPSRERPPTPKRRGRFFTPQFKAQAVLELLAGLKRQAEGARQHELKPQRIARWKDTALEGRESRFLAGEHRDQDQARVADSERRVGRLTMELEVAKNASVVLPSAEARRQVVLTLTAEYPVCLIGRATGWPRSSIDHDAASAADEGRLRRAAGAAGRPVADLWRSTADGHAPTGALRCPGYEDQEMI